MTALKIAKAYSQQDRNDSASPGSSCDETNPLLALVDAASTLLELSPSPSTTVTIPPFFRPCTPEESITSPHSQSQVPTNTPTPARHSPMPTIISATSIVENTKHTFAESLMDMLLDKQYDGIVTFLPDDQQFGIIHARRFSEEIMPKVFGIRTFSSFVRKLNRWGFERVMEKKTHDVDVFRHDLFMKDNWTACSKIKCVGRLAKSTQERRQVSAPVYHNTQQHHHHQQQQQQQQQELNTLMQTQLLRRVSIQTPSFFSQFQPSLQDVTSKVVDAALETLRRDEQVLTAMPPPAMDLRGLLARQQQMHAMQQSHKVMQLSMHGLSPRSSLCLSLTNSQF